MQALKEKNKTFSFITPNNREHRPETPKTNFACWKATRSWSKSRWGT